jgi:hypothetical protein
VLCSVAVPVGQELCMVSVGNMTEAGDLNGAIHSSDRCLSAMTMYSRSSHAIFEVRNLRYMNQQSFSVSALPNGLDQPQLHVRR